VLPLCGVGAIREKWPGSVNAAELEEIGYDSTSESDPQHQNCYSSESGCNEDESNVSDSGEETDEVTDEDSDRILPWDPDDEKMC